MIDTIIELELIVEDFYMRNKKIKVNYFELICKNKQTNNIINFDIDLFFSKISDIALENRVKTYKDDHIRLESFERTKYKGKEYRLLVFNRLSDNNVPKKSKFSSRPELIDLSNDEYIDQECGIVFDVDKSLMLVQAGANSINVKAISEYFLSFYPNDIDTEIEIEINPIVGPNVIDKIRSRQIFRKIEVKLSNVYHDSVLAEDTESKSLIDAFRNCQDSGGNTYKFELSMGYDRRNYLKSDYVIALLKDLIKNRIYISKAEFTSPADVVDEETTVLNFFEINLSDEIVISIRPRMPIPMVTLLDEMLKTIHKRNEYLCQYRER